MLKKFYTHWLESYRGIPRVIWYLSIVSLVNRCGAFVISFLAIYMTKKLGFPLEQAGYVMMCFGVGALTGAFVGGKLTDKLGYHPVQFWSLMLNGIVLLLMMLVRDIWIMGLAVFAMSFASEVFRPANSVAIAQHCEPETRTRSISLYRMAVNLGWTLAPALGGMLVVFGWEWLFWIDGLTCIAASLTLLWLLAPKPKQSLAHNSEETEASKTVSISPYRDRNFLLFVLLTMLGAVVFMQILWTIPLFWQKTYEWSEGQIGKMLALNGLLVFFIEMPLVHRLEGRAPALGYVRFGLILYAVSFALCLLPAGIVAALLVYACHLFRRNVRNAIQQQLCFWTLRRQQAGRIYGALHHVVFGSQHNRAVFGHPSHSGMGIPCTLVFGGRFGTCDLGGVLVYE